MSMNIDDLRARIAQKSTNVEVDSDKILESMTGGTKSNSNYKERAENELKISIPKGSTSASVKVRLLPSPEIFGYLRDRSNGRFEGMTNVPYYTNKTHWMDNKDKKQFYITKCSNTDWNDESCPACNLRKKSILSFKQTDKYHKFLTKDPAKKGVVDTNPVESFLINVFVIDDKQNPQNNGKVMFYSMSKGLFEKVVLPMIKGDEDAGLDGVDVTNVLTGRDFFISVKEGPQYPDYIAGSRFLDSTPFMPFFERKDKSGPNNRSNIVTVPYSSMDEFDAILTNPEYLVDSNVVDPNTGAPLLPVVYKLNTKFMDMLINGLEVDGRNYMPMENLAKMIDPANDPNSFTGDVAIGKFEDLMASYGYDINGDPLAESIEQTGGFGGFDEPALTKEQTASVEGVTRNDFSQETTQTVQSVPTETVELKTNVDAKPADTVDFADIFG